MENQIKGNILAVDDNHVNLVLIKSIFKKHPDAVLHYASDGQEAIDKAKQINPDLILLDIMMPKLDGYQVANILQKENQTTDIPIIFLTALADEEFKLKAFDSGGIDYVTKPINRKELLARVKAQLKMKKIQDELKQKNALLKDRELHLSKLVEEKTHEIEQVTMAMVGSLENANNYNDEDTGNHIRRVSAFSALIAEKLGKSPDFIRRIKLYSSLHDVGKVGIPDSILKKPAKLDDEEWKTMKQHVVIGFKMLDSPVIDEMAKNIALYHHERWDGKGYVSLKSGSDIPIEARIVTLADVFDALTQKRVYKPAFDIEKTNSIISSESGKMFDPDLVKIYFENVDEFFKIKNMWK